MKHSKAFAPIGNGALGTIAGLAAFAAFAATPNPAQAQSVCASRTQLLESLAGEYHEAPRALGMSNDGNVVELLSTQDGQTWTLLVTRPDGVSCVVAAGEMWEAVDQQTAEVDPEA